jgi:4-methylaminobutanoate oxidase (formaldehyde-forming)
LGIQRQQQEDKMSNQIPTQAQIVIIGGGIVGCSTAYHLTRQGYKDVVLIERKELGSGTTWAAAGLVAQLRQNQEMTNLTKYATELYATLEEETVWPPAGCRPGPSAYARPKTGGGNGCGGLPWPAHSASICMRSA